MPRRHFTVSFVAIPLAMFFVSALFFAACCPTVKAPVPSRAALVEPAIPMSLQQVLTQLVPAPKGVILTVGPQWENLPLESHPPAPMATVSEVAQAFGKADRTFGVVRAIAPPTMVLLNTSPSAPDPYAGMSPADLVLLFSASLSEAQWMSLTSEPGLGLASLSETQRSLFAQLLPDGRLRVAPWFGDHNPNTAAERDLSTELPAARLRIKQTAEVQIPAEGEGLYQMRNAPPSGSGVYKLLPSERNYGGSQEFVYGQRVRAEVPNELKGGQLDMGQPVLKTWIPIGGMKTVGDLMARVSVAAHLEIYADRRLEQKTLLILGTGPTAPAEDLLKATAFCLTGAYRHVGPAFLLTDDVEGIATRMAGWREYEKVATAMRQKVLAEARASLYQRFSTQKFSGFGDPLTMTEQESRGGGVKGKLSDLTPVQEQAVRDAAALWEKSYAGSLKAGVMKPLNLDGSIRLLPAVALQIVVPSLQVPVDMGVQLGRSSLFVSPPQMAEERLADSEKQIREMLATHGDEFLKTMRADPEQWVKFTKEFPELTAEILAAHPDLAALINRPPVAAPKFADLLKIVPQRAALVSPQSAEAAASDVAAAKVLGLTQLWVSVFANGRANLSVLTEAVTRASPESAGLKDADLKDADLKDAHAEPLKVFAVVDLLSWGENPPPAAQDLTVLGENSVQANAHQQVLVLQGDHPGDLEKNAGTLGVAVNPLAPIVRETLVTLLRSLAAVPGLAGVVFREMGPIGYDLSANLEDNSNLLLGYQADMRLAFLRVHHADPVDVFSPRRYNGQANTDLPNFQYDERLSEKINDEWASYRRESNLYFLGQMRAAARPLHIIIRLHDLPMGGRNLSGWYATWNNPDSLPTINGYVDKRAQQPVATRTPLAKAGAQPPLVLMELLLDQVTRLAGDPALLGREWQQKHPPGFVIDAGAKRLSTVTDQWAKH